MSPFKLLSLLLCYPDAELYGLRAEIEAAICALPATQARSELLAFLQATANGDLEELQQRYVAAFDFNRRASLHLTYPYQGDRRQRGVALLKLRRLYERLGLVLATDELPDYLPLMLELADMLDETAARELLADFRVAIELAGSALDEQGSDYRHLLAALRALLGPAGEEDLGDVIRLAAQGPPSEQVGLEPFAPPEQMPAAGAMR